MGTQVSVRSILVEVPIGPGLAVEGSLAIPEAARGLVVFVHGSGSSRLSPRNMQVAADLHASDFATLLFDLLSPAEERSDRNTGLLRFDIGFLTRRVAKALDWLRADPELAGLKIGLFGASTGAAAALAAAAATPERVGAVVSRGGRPDLALSSLPEVRCPVLLIVGAWDEPVIGLNRLALEKLAGERELVIVPGATHLFEEPGTLETVSRLAADWFSRHL